VRIALGSRHIAPILGTAMLAALAVWYLTRDGASTAGANTFQTQPASVGRIESIVNTAGTIRPVVTVEVGSELSGLISELNADFNSKVASGEVIARIDDRTIRARLRQIEADVVSARANQEQQRAGVTRARADLELAQSEIARLRDLKSRQLVSQAEVDKSEAAVKIAAAQLEVANAQVAAAAATVMQREAQLEQTKLDLERSYIRSPVDGTVINRQVDVGQTVAASLSAPTLFEIAQDLTKMQIEADVDEADIGQIREGLGARFTVDAHPNRTFDGTVRQVRKAATVTSNVVTYTVIIDAANPDELLLPGMTANVDIVLGTKSEVLRVANSALRFNPPNAGADAARAGGGSPMTDRLEEITDELALSGEQRQAVASALTEMQTAVGEIRDPFASGGPPPIGGPPSSARERVGQLRQRMTNRLAGVLSPEQLARFEQSFGPPGGAPGAGGLAGPAGGGVFPPGGAADGPAGAGMVPGQVWVLENGVPKRVRVLAGLSDAQYTEVRSPELAAGDEVIVRLAR
jgi:HlyD family secretion protein